VWIAFHADLSEFALFDEEIDCLRFAVENSMMAATVKFGDRVRENIWKWADEKRQSYDVECTFCDRQHRSDEPTCLALQEQADG
jgi:hypothetical protein